jgi:hypothetical protein
MGVNKVFRHQKQITKMRNQFSLINAKLSLFLINEVPCYLDEGTRYRSWLRHYDTRRKVAGLIPDEVIGFFN